MSWWHDHELECNYMKSDWFLMKHPSSESGWSRMLCHLLYQIWCENFLVMVWWMMLRCYFAWIKTLTTQRTPHFPPLFEWPPPTHRTCTSEFLLPTLDKPTQQQKVWSNKIYLIGHLIHDVLLVHILLPSISPSASQ